MYKLTGARAALVLFIALFLAACRETGVPPAIRTLTSTPSTRAAPTPQILNSPQATVADEAAASPLPRQPSPKLSPPEESETETAVPRSSTPTPPPPTPDTPPPGALTAITGPLLVDGERGRIYAPAQVNTTPKSVVLSAVDGRLLAAFDHAGQLALDRNHNRLIVDQDGSGSALSSVSLPAADAPAPPQVDPASGLIYAFRDQTVYVVNPETAAVIGTFALNVERTVCDELAGTAPIWQSLYDLINMRLYLTFITRTCTPWISATIVAYDPATLAELDRHDVAANYQAVPFRNNLYGTATSASLAARTIYWTWNHVEGEWYEAGDSAAALQGVVADWGRQLVYEAAGGQIRVVDPETHAVLSRVEVDLLAENGRLAGHDPISDNLYFLSGNGQLQLRPTANLFTNGGEPAPAGAVPPQTAVRALLISPAWPADTTMVGVWEDAECGGGALYILRHGEEAWQRLRVNPAGNCDAITSVVMSPNYVADRTLLVVGNSLDSNFRSNDDGRHWQAGQTTLPAPGRLLISSGFAADQTIFFHAATGELYRSRDGGQTLTQLEPRFDRVAVSPEFGQDQILMGSRENALFISRDGGSGWEPVGHAPGEAPLALLSLAPLFTGWQTAFAFNSSGQFYRSLDGGETWEIKMETADIAPAQIAYAPDIEVDRPLFLLHCETVSASYDGGASIWSTNINWPPLITTMAISPNFVGDGLLFLGTADGQILSVNAARPEF